MEKKLIIFMPSINYGGVEKNLFVISNYLSQNGMQIEVLTCNNDMKKMFNKNIKFIGTKNKFWQKRNKKIKYLICLFLLFINLLFKKKNTIVFSFQANIYAILVARLLNTKIVIRSNTSPQGWAHNYFKNIIYSNIIKLTNGIIVNSLEFKKQFYKFYKFKVNCIYNPFDKNFVKKQLKEKININFYKKDYLNILTVGRLTDQKDHLTILKAIKNLKKTFKIRLIIIGNGFKQRELLNYIKDNDMRDQIKLIGFKKNPFPYIIKSDVIILSSLYEGLPNILLEAQYLKKYIISTNCPTGPKEILINGKAGDLVKIGDYKKISNLLNNYYRRKRVIRKKIDTGYDNFNRFDYSINCNQYLKLLSQHF